MNRFFKILLFLCIITLTGFVFLQHTESNPSVQSVTNDTEALPPVTTLQDIVKEKADSALIYCKEKDFNTDYCVLIDFGIPSGKERFFVWDFKGDSIKYASLCAHGYGQNSTMQTPVFSNVEGSYCSSLGRYKIGARSWSKWGINVHYKLHGLDKTNDNAFKRIVVLHSFEHIPEKEIHPSHLPLGMSQGCPVISNKVMKDMDVLLKEIKKPMLLWIYY